ncbi:hypothetical protein CLOM_g17367 [Closterium sp. NIES-68]|nr:hypothetical protein CLOM_g17367 [Closterium sp. NIES-68]GJP66667.1 hypothetical protein CLOP_g23577 [Closterium sp. NIES-67]
MGSRTGMTPLILLLCIAAAVAPGAYGGRDKFPVQLGKSKFDMSTCRRVYGMKPAVSGIIGTTMESLAWTPVGRSWAYKVSFAFLAIGLPSAPSSQAVVSGFPCDPFTPPTTILSLPGTWQQMPYKRGVAWQLTGNVASSAIVTAFQNQKSQGKKRSKVKIYAMLNVNGTVLYGEMDE